MTFMQLQDSIRFKLVFYVTFPRLFFTLKEILWKMGFLSIYQDHPTIQYVYRTSNEVINVVRLGSIGVVRISLCGTPYIQGVPPGFASISRVNTDYQIFFLFFYEHLWSKKMFLIIFW